MPAPSAISTTVELYFWKSGLKDGLTCDLATKVKKKFFGFSFSYSEVYVCGIANPPSLGRPRSLVVAFRTVACALSSSLDHTSTRVRSYRAKLYMGACGREASSMALRQHRLLASVSMEARCSSPNVFLNDKACALSASRSLPRLARARAISTTTGTGSSRKAAQPLELQPPALAEDDSRQEQRQTPLRRDQDGPRASVAVHAESVVNPFAGLQAVRRAEQRMVKRLMAGNKHAGEREGAGAGEGPLRQDWEDLRLARKSYVDLMRRHAAVTAAASIRPSPREAGLRREHQHRRELVQGPEQGQEQGQLGSPAMGTCASLLEERVRRQAKTIADLVSRVECCEAEVVRVRQERQASLDECTRLQTELSLRDAAVAQLQARLSTAGVGRMARVQQSQPGHEAEHHAEYQHHALPVPLHTERRAEPPIEMLAGISAIQPRRQHLSPSLVPTSLCVRGTAA